MVCSKFGLNKYENLDDKWWFLDKVMFDRYIFFKLKELSVFVVLLGIVKNVGWVN